MSLAHKTTATCIVKVNVRDLAEEVETRQAFPATEEGFFVTAFHALSVAFGQSSCPIVEVSDDSWMQDESAAINGCVPAAASSCRPSPRGASGFPDPNPQCTCTAHYVSYIFMQAHWLQI